MSSKSYLVDYLAVDDSLVDVSVDGPPVDGQIADLPEGGQIADPPEGSQVVESPVGVFYCWSFSRCPVDGSPVDVLLMILGLDVQSFFFSKCS